MPPRGIQQQLEHIAQLTAGVVTKDSAVQSWSFEPKFVRAVDLAITSGKIPSETAAKLREAIQPAAVATTVGMFAAVAGVHYINPLAGGIVDVIMLAYFGTDTALRAYRIYLDVDGAQSEADLQTAAATIANEIAAEGSGKLIELLTWGAGKVAGKVLKSKTNNETNRPKSDEPTNHQSDGPTGKAGSDPSTINTDPEAPKTNDIDAGRPPENVVAPSTYSATLGKATSTDYKGTFFKANPKLEGEVVVHHAIEQQVLTRYPGVLTESELHSLENLRGVPKSINSDVHLSKIRIEWNKFYKPFDLNGTVPTRQQLLDKATEIDKLFGSQFTPPAGG